MLQSQDDKCNISMKKNAGLDSATCPAETHDPFKENREALP